MPDQIELGTHILFVPSIPKPKTKTWCVKNQYGHEDIGYIQWHAPWRKYSFFPISNTIFEEVCLREIAEFIERKTKEHKQGK
jgi:hypothetical protein